MRNIFHIPPAPNDKNRAEGEDTTHDKVIKGMLIRKMKSRLRLKL